MIGFDWLGLCKLEEAWAAAGADFGTQCYDSLGRPFHALYGYASQQASRAQRVYDALQQSGPAAQSMLVQRLRNISLGAIWDLLESLVRDIAMTYCGLAIGGGAVGAVLGAFAGGVGAVPGAIAGASAGLAAATAYLEFMGLICLAKSLAGAFSEAMGCYSDGVGEAWGPAPNPGRFHREPGEARGDVALATQQIAQGHVQLLVALLSGIAMYLIRGGADRLRVLSEIRGSKQLGPRVERWVLENEQALVREAGLRGAPRPTGPEHAVTGAAPGGTARSTNARTNSQFDDVASPRSSSPLGRVLSSHSAIEPGPLDASIADTFAGGRYKVVELGSDTTLYRAGTEGKPLGQFFDTAPPTGIAQARIDKAVLPVWPDGSTSPIDRAFAVSIPKGTTVYVGEVSSQSGFYVGGTQQIVVLKPWTIQGVQILDSTPLK